MATGGGSRAGSSRRSRARFAINLVSERESGLFIVPRHEEKSESRESRRNGIRRGRCDAAIRAPPIRLPLFVPAAPRRAERSGAASRRAGEESRSFSINALPLVTAEDKLYSYLLSAFRVGVACLLISARCAAR